MTPWTTYASVQWRREASGCDTHAPISLTRRGRGRARECRTERRTFQTPETECLDNPAPRHFPAHSVHQQDASKTSTVNPPHLGRLYLLGAPGRSLQAAVQQQCTCPRRRRAPDASTTVPMIKEAQQQQTGSADSVCSVGDCFLTSTARTSPMTPRCHVTERRFPLVSVGWRRESRCGRACEASQTHFRPRHRLQRPHPPANCRRNRELITSMGRPWALVR